MPPGVGRSSAVVHHPTVKRQRTKILKGPGDFENPKPAVSTQAGAAGVGKHHIFSWINVPVGEESRELDAEEVVDELGVPVRVVAWHVRMEIRDSEAFKSLPFALFLVMIYSWSFLSHDQAGAVRNVEHAIQNDLINNAVFAYVDPGAMAHKNLFDVHNFADFFSWLRVGVLPLLFRPQQLWSELPVTQPWPNVSESKAARLLYLHYNRLIGGIQLKQGRAASAPCRYKDVAHTLNMSCLEMGRGALALNLQPEEQDILQASGEGFDADLTHWFLTVGRFQEMTERLRWLELDDWLGRTTVEVVLSFMTYNAQVDLLTLTEVHFFFSHSGHIWKQIVQSSIILNPYSGIMVFFPDFSFLCMTLWIFFTEMKEVVGECRKRHKRGWTIRQTISQYVDIWNIVDWISVASGFIVITMWARYVILSSQLADEVAEVTVAESVAGSSSMPAVVARFSHLVEVLFAQFRRAEMNYHWLRIVASIYPVVLMLRLFKAFDAQPRLSLLTRTLAHAATDVMHFGVVFCAIFLSFAMMGTSLFGRELEEFNTFPRAVVSCFVILMGEFDSKELWTTGRSLAVIWFISFQCIILLVMLNMLLAIIMDTYTDVKGHIIGGGAAATLPSQIRKVWRRWIQLKRGKRVSLVHVERELSETVKTLLPEEMRKLPTGGSQHTMHDGGWQQMEIMTINDFQRYVTNLGEEQARRLMLESTIAWQRGTEPSMGLSDAARVMGILSGQLESILDELDDSAEKLCGTRSKSFGVSDDVIKLNSYRIDSEHHSPRNAEGDSIEVDAVGLCDASEGDRGGEQDGNDATYVPSHGPVVSGQPASDWPCISSESMSKASPGAPVVQIPATDLHRIVDISKEGQRPDASSLEHKNGKDRVLTPLIPDLREERLTSIERRLDTLAAEQAARFSALEEGQRKLLELLLPKDDAKVGASSCGPWGGRSLASFSEVKYPQ